MLLDVGSRSLVLVGVGLQPFLKRLSHFLHLGNRARADVWLIRIQSDVILVIFFGRIEAGEGLEGCDDRILEGLGIIQLLDISGGDFFLVFVLVEDGRTILMADVVSLAVFGGGIVCG